MIREVLTVKFSIVLLSALALAGCATSGFGEPVERDLHNKDYRLIGITGGVDTILSEGLTQRRCRMLGREYHKNRGRPGWGVHEQLACERAQ